jgi:hypothetical protein
MNIDNEPTKTERKAGRLLIMKRVLEILGWLAAVALFVFAGRAVFAAGGTQNGNPIGGVSLTRHAFNGAAAQQQQQQQQDGAQDEPADRRARARKARERDDVSPASILREAHTFYVAPTTHLEKKYLEYKLNKYEELRDWNLMLVANPSAADLVINVDKTALNYIFTVTDARTSVIVASGKCIAVNGRVAAEYLGKEIIRKLKDVRASGDGGRRRKHSRDDADDDEWSES